MTLARVLFLPVLLSGLFFLSCDLFGLPQRRLRPYNPQRAGATIVASFDIGRDLGLTRLNNDWDIQTRFAVAEHNGSMYINIGETIFVFNKSCFTKTGTIQINFPRNDPERRAIRFVITDQGHAFLSSSSANGEELWHLDMATGDVILVDDAFFPYFDIGRRLWLEGHNRADNSIWFHEWSPLYTHIFTYDADANIFIHQERKRSHWYSFSGTSIFGNTVWSSWHHQLHRNQWVVLITKYDVNDNTRSLHSINVDYLNTLTVPQSALYVPPYLWLMVDRNRRVEMLKLRPHVNQTGSLNIAKD